MANYFYQSLESILISVSSHLSFMYDFDRVIIKVIMSLIELTFPYVFCKKTEIWIEPVLTRWHATLL